MVETGQTIFYRTIRMGVFATRYLQKVEKTLTNVLRTLHFETVFEVCCQYGRISKAIRARRVLDVVEDVRREFFTSNS